MLDFNRFRILTFDCYGTLIDWETGILNAVRPCVSQHGVGINDSQILEVYAEIEAMLEEGPYRPYRKILHQVMAMMCKRFGFDPDPEQYTTIADSIQNWPPFADTVEALKALKSKYQLAIVSNVDDDLFAGSQKHLKVEFDHVITAGQSLAYKPSKKMFEYAVGEIGLPKEQILHVAQSLYHDHVPAQEFGLSTVWINRRQGQAGSGATPVATATPDAEFPDMASFARATGV